MASSLPPCFCGTRVVDVGAAWSRARGRRAMRKFPVGAPLLSSIVVSSLGLGCSSCCSGYRDGCPSLGNVRRGLPIDGRQLWCCCYYRVQWALVVAALRRRTYALEPGPTSFWRFLRAYGDPGASGYERLADQAMGDASRKSTGEHDVCGGSGMGCGERVYAFYFISFLARDVWATGYLIAVCFILLIMRSCGFDPSSYARRYA